MSAVIINEKNSSEKLNNEVVYKRRRNFFSGLKNKLIEKFAHEFGNFDISHLIVSFLSLSNKSNLQIKSINCSEKINRKLKEILKKELD